MGGKEGGKEGVLRVRRGWKEGKEGGEQDGRPAC